MDSFAIPDKLLTISRIVVCGMTQPARLVYKFEDFRLDPADRVFLRLDEPISLAPKVFDTLLLLVENAGHLVEKETFMRRLWPDTFVGDDALAQNISILRKCLSNGDVAREWIATVPRRGYRFVGPVHEEVEAGQNHLADTSLRGKTAAPEPQPENNRSSAASSPSRPLFSRLSLFAIAIAVGTLAGVLSYALLAPPAVPRVIRMTQLTHSGRVDLWQKLISDGSRIYFLERDGDHWNLAQTSLSGGETQIVPAPFPGTILLDLSPDHSEFLMGSFTTPIGGELPLWTWPVQGGPATRVGDVTASNAAWHPNGRQIVYGKEDGVYIADRDGSKITRIAAMHGQNWSFAWSPDGKVLRFSVKPIGIQSSSIWEVRTDGANLHQMLAHWSSPLPVEWGGSWSADGAYFFFGSSHAGSTDLWGLQEKSAFLRSRTSEPFRLTTGPAAIGGALVSSTDRRKLYAAGETFQVELTNYDPKSRQSTVMLPGNRASQLRYSPDGEWLVYTAAPHDLWRVHRDGGHRTHLTGTPAFMIDPVFSPDAKQIAFVNRPADCENKLFVISADGGVPRELFPNDCEQFDPAWSPDGKILGFARAKFLPDHGFEPSTIELLDVVTNRVTTLVGSKGLRAPSWSPDGKFIAALTEDYSKLVLFDVRSEKWTELSKGVAINGAFRWSRDSAFLYFQDWRAPNQPVYRIRLRDHKREEVANFESFLRSGIQVCAFYDLAPDGSFVVGLLRNRADIYALDLQIP